MTDKLVYMYIQNPIFYSNGSQNLIHTMCRWPLCLYGFCSIDILITLTYNIYMLQYAFYKSKI